MSINDISKSNLRFSFEIIFEKLIRKGKNKKIKGLWKLIQGQVN